MGFLLNTRRPFGFFKNKVDHFSYRDFDHYMTKQKLYAQIQAQQLHDKGQRVRLFHLFVKTTKHLSCEYFAE